MLCPATEGASGGQCGERRTSGQTAGLKPQASSGSGEWPLLLLLLSPMVGRAVSIALNLDKRGS